MPPKKYSGKGGDISADSNAQNLLDDNPLLYSSVSLTEFAEALRAGDSVKFSLLMSKACGPILEADLPVCDGCCDSMIKAWKDDAAAELERVRNLEILYRSLTSGSSSSKESGESQSHPSDLPFSRETGAHSKSTFSISRALDEQYVKSSPSSSPVPLFPHTVPSKESSVLELASGKATHSRDEMESLLSEIDDYLLVIQEEADIATSLAKKKLELDDMFDSIYDRHRQLTMMCVDSRTQLMNLYQRQERLRVYLSRIRCISLLSDALYIWHNGPYATINGVRFGRITYLGQSPSWHEVNAALGQLALLVSCTAAKLGYVFQKYKVVPMGSFSRILVIEEGRTGGRTTHSESLDLFHSGDSGWAAFPQNRLNNAMKAFAICISELGDRASQLDPSFCLPHPISKPLGDKVGNVSLLLGKDTVWTRACKLLAINMKWITAWAVKEGYA